MAAQSYLSYDGGSHWEDLDLWFLQNLQLERRRLSRKRVQISQVGAIQQGFVDLIGDCDDLGYYRTVSHVNFFTGHKTLSQTANYLECADHQMKIKEGTH